MSGFWKRMTTSTMSETIENPITIGSIMNDTSKKCMRPSKTRGLAFETGSKKVSEGSLNLSLYMSRKRGKPNGEWLVVTKSVKWRNEATMILHMLDNAIPPRGKIKKRVNSECGKVLLKLFLSLGIKAMVGQVGKEKVLVHMNRRSTNREIKDNTMIRMGSIPRDNGTGDRINNHIGKVMDIALKVLPGGTVTRRSRVVGTLLKKGSKTKRKGETFMLKGVPGGVQGRWGRRR
jgi:hypothetical protein